MPLIQYDSRYDFEDDLDKLLVRENSELHRQIRYYDDHVQKGWWITELDLVISSVNGGSNILEREKLLDTYHFMKERNINTITSGKTTDSGAQLTTADAIFGTLELGFGPIHFSQLGMLRARYLVPRSLSQI